MEDIPHEEQRLYASVDTGFIGSALTTYGSKYPAARW
jgi:hypothetical protein